MNKLAATYSLFLLAVLMFALSGCKPRVPGKYISPGKMEDILYDYHIASAASSIHADYADTLRMQVYKLAVLKKYKVSEADFDSSMVYYMRHAERLHRIYENLAKRLGNEALALGTSTSEVNQYLAISNSGDTANVWTGDKSFILSHQPGFNVYSFTVQADSTFQEGDRFVLNFQTKFIFQDGTRDGVALIALCFSNDSIASRMIRMSGDSSYKLDISDDKRVGIKKVSGYFLLNKGQGNESTSTLRLMHVNGVSLFRMHIPKPEEPKTEAVDSLTNLPAEQSDSDSLAKPRPLQEGRAIRHANMLPEGTPEPQRR